MSAELPIVSVIIPCFNQAHFLPEAIESCLAQTYPRVEVIVVDDGSPDNTSEVAAGYQQVRCIRRENGGLAVARNRGFEESRGEFLIFLDSDDRLRPKAVELGMKHLREHPNAAFAYGRCELVKEDGSFLIDSDQPRIERDHYRRLLHGCFMPNPGAVLFRRSVLEKLGTFHTGFPACEDYEIYLRLSRTYEACAYDDVVSDYRQHDSSMSRKAALMADSVHKVLTAQIPFVAENKTYEPDLKAGFKTWRKKYHAHELITRINDSAREGRWSAVSADVLSLARANPQILAENTIRKAKLELRKLKGQK